MNKKYEKTGYIHSCRFSVDDLVQVGNIITADFNSLSKPVKVTVGQPDGEFTIEDYHNITEYDHLIPTFQKVSFYVTSGVWDNSQAFPQSISLQISRTSIYLNVSGINDSWVRGNFERIKEFLQTKERSIWYRLSVQLHSVVPVLCGLAFAFNLALGLSGHPYFLASAGLFFILLVWLFRSIKKIVTGEWFPHTVFASSKNVQVIEQVDKIKIKLALLTLIAAILTMILAAIPIFRTIPIKLGVTQLLVA